MRVKSSSELFKDAKIWSGLIFLEYLEYFYLLLSAFILLTVGNFPQKIVKIVIVKYFKKKNLSYRTSTLFIIL